MQLTNRTNSYGWISIVLHWVVAFVVIGLFILGLWMVDLDYYSNWYHEAPFIHKSLGVLLVGTMLFRLFWNTLSPTPRSYGKVDSSVANRLIRGLHLLFYLLVVLIGLSGYLISTAEGQGISVFDWFEVPALSFAFEEQADIAGEIHLWLAYTLMIFVGLHALGAIKHHFMDKDNTLKRILKP